MKKIVLFDDKKDCSGCGACFNICPKQAIDMRADEVGFIYPYINDDKCIACGLCKKVCYFQNENVLKESDLKTFVAISQDTKLEESASGGVFASIAQSIIKNNGYAYGCAMVYENEELIPKHICVDKLENLTQLKGSKYVQSNAYYIYKEIKKKLDKGRIVLFSGTPCQVSGLKGYLQKKYETLFTIDIVCHGVPSVQLFHDYLNLIEKKRDIKIINYKFRDKHDGWKLHGKMTYCDKNKNMSSEYFDAEESSYYQMFLNSYIYRKNCYFCPYASKNRQGDITIGDYWCIDLVHPEYMKNNGGIVDDTRGVSCLIINNERGNKLVNQYGQGILYLSSSYEYASRYNGQLMYPSPYKCERDYILKKYVTKGYEDVENWYQRRLKKIRFKRNIRSKIPKLIKIIYRKYIK